MTLTFASIMASVGIEPAETLVIRHAYVPVHRNGSPGINDHSTVQNSLPM